jgi:LPS export ABC transporter protein LptC
MKNILKVAVIVLAVTGACFYFFKPTGKDVSDKKGTSSSEAGSEVEQNVTSFSISGRSPKGVRQWHLDGDSAQIIGDDIHLNNLKATAYTDEATVDLTSDSGIYRKEKGEVELVGNVHVVSGTDFALSTDSARWSQNTKEIYTEEVVHINREGMEAVGTGGMANSDEKWARLNKDVTVKIEPDTMVKSAGQLEVRYEQNIAVFRDDVMVEDKDGRLFADVLTVEFDPESQKLAQVIAEGNVKVKKGNSYTLSDKAIYSDSTKSAKLLGRPRIIIDPGELGELDKRAIY